MFWDFGYSAMLPDLDFLPAVLLLTRVISKPGANRLCLDLGHKAVASENPPPRVQLLDLPEPRQLGTARSTWSSKPIARGSFAVGSTLYGVPWHVCPTVALHNEVVVIRDGRAVERWKVVARARTITI